LASRWALESAELLEPELAEESMLAAVSAWLGAEASRLVLV